MTTYTCIAFSNIKSLDLNGSNYDSLSVRMAAGSCGLVAIHVWQGVSSTRLHDQSLRKVRVRPILMEPGTRQRHSWAAVADHNVYAFLGGVVPSPKLGVQLE